MESRLYYHRVCYNRICAYLYYRNGRDKWPAETGGWTWRFWDVLSPPWNSHALWQRPARHREPFLHRWLRPLRRLRKNRALFWPSGEAKRNRLLLGWNFCTFAWMASRWDNSGSLRLCCALWRLYAYGKSFFISNIKITKLPMIQAINFLRCVPIVSSLLALPGISDVCDSIVASGQAWHWPDHVLVSVQYISLWKWEMPFSNH